MMSAKVAIPDFLKIKVFWSKAYGVITSAQDLASKILSRNSNCAVAVVMWPTFGNSSISATDVIINSILKGFDQKKPLFLRGGLDSRWEWVYVRA